ncbi:hypothetical protein BC939DRAFT_500909 [Gamsiella multidivaricata]|uniref:uncharacterized protein n=1 Tax=Gamsiella multidivaricata TaxID=101098 RepID=UPI0022207C8E|nr:uncharacterized protein BC939DRAFT_500909 [Gamsiella multidivaricata]KAG0353992.1 hypothetical protein BGZ54_001906 [Gamsiella multidivaricata]KAI7828255.1 hypothetical protein BC939DRAFT_500909 [Gamsiella multidivaricata]
MRVAANLENMWSVDLLLRIGEGTEPAVAFGGQRDYIHIPPQIIFIPLHLAVRASPEKQLIKVIYPTIDTAPLNPDFLMNSVILTPCNRNVARMNNIRTCCIMERTGDTRARTRLRTLRLQVGMPWNT